MLRQMFVFLLVCSLASVLSANDSSSFNRLKTWTHTNGNSAVLELVDCQDGWVKFKKLDGKHWTMPVSDLIASDRNLVIELTGERDFRTVLAIQDDDLDTVRTSFNAIRTENPDLYRRLNELAEYPIEDYEVRVNDQGVYYLQFMLKEGLGADGEVESQVQTHLNATNLGDPIEFRLSQIPQEISESEVPMPEDDTADAPPIPDEDLSVDMMMHEAESSLAPATSAMEMPIDIESASMSSPFIADAGACGCNTMVMPSNCSDVVYYSPCPANTSCGSCSSCTSVSHCSSCQSDCCSQFGGLLTRVQSSSCCSTTMDNCCNVSRCNTPRTGFLRRLFCRLRLR